MAKQVLGIISIIWQGVKYPCEKGASFTQGGITSKPYVAGGQIFAEQEMMAGMVKCKLPFTKGMSIAPFASGTTGELQFVCDTGQTYVDANAFRSKQAEITGTSIDVDWVIGEAEELVQ